MGIPFTYFIHLYNGADALVFQDTAIVNGFMQEPKETSITSLEAQKLGVCVDVSRDKENGKACIIEIITRIMLILCRMSELIPNHCNPCIHHKSKKTKNHYGNLLIKNSRVNPRLLYGDL